MGFRTENYCTRFATIFTDCAKMWFVRLKGKKKVKILRLYLHLLISVFQSNFNYRSGEGIGGLLAV